MFLGTHYHSLESKGRLAVPSSFRRLLGLKPIVTRGLDGCLFLVPKSTWSSLTKDLRGSPLTSKDAREFIRHLSHAAKEVSFDAQGRALIPETLRSYANLKKRIVVAGSLDWVEIWDQDKYHQHIEKTEKYAEQIAERLTKLNDK